MMIKHLYIHIPFCDSICFYCDFSRIIYQKEYVTKWLKSLEIEINNKCFDQYETIYIGGGTPTSLDIDELDKLLSLIKPYTNNIIEYTIEINPESINLDKIKLFKKYGINRVSIGCQSTNDRLLKEIGRRHSFNDVKNAVLLLRENDINNISIDLMYSLPNQSIDDLNNSLDDILALDINHISIYSLTIEPNSIFGKRNIKSLDEEIEADMYELIERKLLENNYIHYEISNYCKKNYESKHNIAYWEYEDFLGISLAAASKINHQRYTNTSSFKKYFEDINNKDELINLSKEDEMFENIMMSLRMDIGIDLIKFKDRYNVDLLEYYSDAINNDKENLTIIDNRLICTNREILNNILLDFMN